MNALLLSNSTGPGGYLTDALDAIARHADGAGQAVFIPFAAVVRSWDDYAEQVARALAPMGLQIEPLHRATDPQRAIEGAAMLIVGGGNTFHLLHHCRRQGVLAPLRAAALRGVPYLGWSAGSNLACPTIGTTNDMPIVDPGGFDALDLIPFQINPHYTNALPQGVRGESRNDRLAEFTRANPRLPVLGLPEGNWLRVTGEPGRLQGEIGGALPSWQFHADAAPEPVAGGPLPTFFFNPRGVR